MSLQLMPGPCVSEQRARTTSSHALLAGTAIRLLELVASSPLSYRLETWRRTRLLAARPELCRRLLVYSFQAALTLGSISF